MTAPGPAWRLVAAGVVCAALAACGSTDPDEGTNGVGKLPAEEIEELALEAATEAETVRLSGSVITEGHAYRLDMRLGPHGGVGEVSDEHTTFELLRVDEELFLMADAQFWQEQQDGAEDESGDPDPAEKLEGMYVKVAPEDPTYEQLSGFTDKGVLMEGLLTLEGERQTGERGELDGVQTIRVEAGGGTGGAMEVSLLGTPYPLVLERGGEAGQLKMAEWNKDFSLRPPPDEQVVDYGDQMLTTEDD